MRNTLAFLISVLALAAPAAAQVSGPAYVFVNGTAANADEVNADFAAIYSAALNRTGGTMTGALNTLGVLPVTTNVSDLGSTSKFYQSLYLRTSTVLGQTTANYTLTWANPASARAISIADPGGTDVFTFNAATQTLTNKTLTAPVLSGSVTGTYTLAGTPTITSPTISGPTLSGTVIGTYTLGGTPTIPATGLTGVCCGSATNVALLNAGNTFTVSTGAAIVIQPSVTTNGAYVTFGTSGGTNFVGSDDSGGGGFGAGASGLAVYGAAAAGVTLRANNAAGVINFKTGGNNLRWGVNAAGDLIFGASSHIADSSGTPTIASGFGALPSITGADYTITLVVGTGTNTGGTVNFGHTQSSAPACSLSTDSAGVATNMTISTSTTQAVIAWPNQLAPGNHVYVLCRGS